MGNSLGCSASGERLVSAARDGDLLEARMLLEFNPCLARYSTFGGLNSPLHFAAAKGHKEIVSLLLENGADVNSRNYCGQVTRTDYLSGRTALHFAAVNGHVRCIRLVVADFIPSAPYEFVSSVDCGDLGDGSLEQRCNQHAVSKFVNKAADGGITALHMAALNGHSDCVQLLVDIHANVSVVTFHYGTSMDLIGAGSTPLHYAACGGNLKCCQILLARGASRLTLNCNGYVVVALCNSVASIVDVARIWGRHWLEPLLLPNSDVTVPTFPPSKFLSLPLLSILNIARSAYFLSREAGLQSSTTASDDSDLCAVCLERVCTVAAEGCGHELCTSCALYLCSTSNITTEMVGPPGSIPCPLCRHGIVSFMKLPGSPAKELDVELALGCTPCMLHTCDPDPPQTSCQSEFRKNRVASVAPDLFCPISCSPFPSISIPSCACNEGTCPSLEPSGGEAQDQSPRRSQQGMQGEHDKLEGPRIEKTSCSSMFWNRRSCHREHQCNSELNT
ncbi:E3 ubiquitin-protein ligase xbat33 [Asimina triloba]